MEDWIPIQNRGQCNYPKNFFFDKTWNDYKIGFGIPGNPEATVNKILLKLLFYFCKTTPI